MHVIDLLLRRVLISMFVINRIEGSYVITIAIVKGTLLLQTGILSYLWKEISNYPRSLVNFIGITYVRSSLRCS